MRERQQYPSEDESDSDSEFDGDESSWRDVVLEPASSVLLSLGSAVLV